MSTDETNLLILTERGHLWIGPFGVHYGRWFIRPDFCWKWRRQP